MSTENTNAGLSQKRLKIPFLALVPQPFLRVRHSEDKCLKE